MLSTEHTREPACTRGQLHGHRVRAKMSGVNFVHHHAYLGARPSLSHRRRQQRFACLLSPHNASQRHARSFLTISGDAVGLHIKLFRRVEDVTRRKCEGHSELWARGVAEGRREARHFH